MYLLSGESLTKAEWFRPERQPLNLDGQKSTSSLTIGPEAPEIPIGAWMLDDEDPGAGIVWRVQTVDTQFDTKTRTVQLEHIANTLKDISIFGEIEPKDITGNADSTTCTARQAFEFILARHDSWQLGTMAGEFENVSNPYSFNGEDLLSAMESVTSSLGDAYWDFDLTSLPFRVNILKLGEDVGCEMRMNRNITTMRKTVDRRRMYTRFYPIGENDIHIDGDYITQNKDQYGLVVKIETDSSKKTKAELLQWAQERLARHCEPSVTITISGIELSEATGEPLDHFREHTKCRVPLPEFGTTITEKVTKLSWRDKIHEKKNVSITLANQREDIASIVNRLNKKNAAGARAKAKKDKEDHAWFVDTEDHVGMVAEAIIGQGPDGVDWSRVSSLIVDGEGIHGRVTRAEGYLVTMKGQMDMNEESLRIAFENMGSLRSEFAISAESLRIAFQNDLNCTRMEFQASSESMRIAFENEKTSVRSELIQQANLIGMVVDTTDPSNPYIKAAEITAEMNKDGSTVRINANRIRIGDGTSSVTLNDAMTISGNYTRMKRPVEFGTGEVKTIINGGVVTAQHLDTTHGGDMRIYDSSGNHYDLNYTAISKLLVGVGVTGGGTNQFRITDNSGNTYDIYKSGNDLVFKDNTENVSWTFSKAVTLSEAWSNGDFPLTINATQTNGGTTTNVGSKSIGFTNASDIYVTVEKNGTPSAFGSSKKLINVPFKIVHHAGGQVGDQNRYSSSLASVDASSVYDNGWNDVVLSDPDWQYPAEDHNSDNTTAANSVIVAASAKSDGTLRQKAIPIALTVDTTNKVAKVSTGGHIRAQAAIDMKTNDEYNTAVTNATRSGKASVTLNDPTWDSISGALPSSRTVTVSTSGRTNSSGTTDNLSKSISLFLTQGNWSSNKLTVSMRTGSTSGTAYAQTEVDASSLVTSATRSGKASVTLNDPTWNSISGTPPASRTVTVSTSGRTNSSGTTENLSKSVTVTVSVDSSNAYVKHGSTTIAQVSHSYKYTQAQYEAALASVPSGYYSQTQYDNHYKEGWNSGWNAYYNDSEDWFSAYDEGGGVKSVWIPKKTSSYDYYSHNGHGNGSSSTCELWFQYSSASTVNCSHRLLSSFYCTIIYNSNGTRTLRCEHTYSATESIPFNNGSTHNLYY